MLCASFALTAAGAAGLEQPYAGRRVAPSAEGCRSGVYSRGCRSPRGPPGAGSGREPGNRLGAMIDTQLAVDVRDMPLDGGQADHQFIGDLLVPPARRDQTQNLEFPRRERLREASDPEPRRDSDGVGPLVERGQQSS